MFKITVLLSWAIAVALAAPPVDVVPLEKQQPTVIPIVSQSDELEANGTYKFSYETGNGIKREETAYEKVVPKLEGRSASSDEGGESYESDEIHVQRGSYSYTAPDGTVITLSYIADENGFQPIGDHIPRVPGVASASSHSSEKSGRALKNSDSVESASIVKESKVEAKSAPLDQSKPAESVSTASLPQSDVLKKPEPVPAANADDQKTNPSTSESNKLEETSTPISESAQTEASSVASEESTSNSESSSESASTVAVAQDNDASSASIVDDESQAPVSTAVPEQASTTISPEAVEPASTVSSSNDETPSTEANQQSSTASVEPLTEGENQSTISEASTNEEPSSTTVSA